MRLLINKRPTARTYPLCFVRCRDRSDDLEVGNIVGDHTCMIDVEILLESRIKISFTYGKFLGLSLHYH